MLKQYSVPRTKYQDQLDATGYRSWPRRATSTRKYLVGSTYVPGTRVTARNNAPTHRAQRWYCRTGVPCTTYRDRIRMSSRTSGRRPRVSGSTLPVEISTQTLDPDTRSLRSFLRDDRY